MAECQFAASLFDGCVDYVDIYAQTNLLTDKVMGQLLNPWLLPTSTMNCFLILIGHVVGSDGAGPRRVPVGPRDGRAEGARNQHRSLSQLELLPPKVYPDAMSLLVQLDRILFVFNN